MDFPTANTKDNSVKKSELKELIKEVLNEGSPLSLNDAIGKTVSFIEEDNGTFTITFTDKSYMTFYSPEHASSVEYHYTER